MKITPNFKGYAYIDIYSTIKGRVRGRIIETSELKEILMRHYFCNKGIGGTRKGFPKYLMYPILKDLEAMGLLVKINHMRYEIVFNDCDKILKSFPF